MKRKRIIFWSKVQYHISEIPLHKTETQEDDTGARLLNIQWQFK